MPASLEFLLTSSRGSYHVYLRDAQYVPANSGDRREIVDPAMNDAATAMGKTKSTDSRVFVGISCVGGWYKEVVEVLEKCPSVSPATTTEPDLFSSPSSNIHYQSRCGLFSHAWHTVPV